MQVLLQEAGDQGCIVRRCVVDLLQRSAHLCSQSARAAAAPLQRTWSSENLLQNLRDKSEQQEKPKSPGLAALAQVFSYLNSKRKQDEASRPELQTVTVKPKPQPKKKPLPGTAGKGCSKGKGRGEGAMKKPAAARGVGCSAGSATTESPRKKPAAARGVGCSADSATTESPSIHGADVLHGSEGEFDEGNSSGEQANNSTTEAKKDGADVPHGSEGEFDEGDSSCPAKQANNSKTKAKKDDGHSGSWAMLIIQEQ